MSSISIATGLISVLQHLQWKDLTIVSSDKVEVDFLAVSLLKEMSLLSKYANCRHSEDNGSQFGKSWNVLYLANGEPSEADIRNILASLPRADSFFLVTKSPAKVNLQMPFPVSYYQTSYEELSEGRFERVVTDWESQFSCQMNGQHQSTCLNSALGARFKAISLDHEMYLELNNCTNETCQGFGLLADFIASVSKEANFSVNYRREPSGLWGGTSLSAFNHSSQLNGIFGQTARRENDMPLAGWIPNAERNRFVDFTFTVVKEQNYCFVSSHRANSPRERMFLLRPLNPKSWAALIGLILLAIMLFVSFCLLFKPAERHSWTLRLLLGICGLAFTAFHSFYSSYLTMFMATIPQAPFDTFREVIESDWEIVFARGDESAFNFFGNDPIFTEANAFYTSEEYRRTQKDIFGTLSDMEDRSRAVLISTDKRVQRSLFDMGEEKPDLLRCVRIQKELSSSSSSTRLPFQILSTLSSSLFNYGSQGKSFAAHFESSHHQALGVWEIGEVRGRMVPQRRRRQRRKERSRGSDQRQYGPHDVGLDRLRRRLRRLPCLPGLGGRHFQQRPYSPLRSVINAFFALTHRLPSWPRSSYSKASL